MASSYQGANAMYAKMQADMAAKKADEAAGSSGAAAAPPAEAPPLAAAPVIKAPKDGVLITFGCTNFDKMGTGVQTDAAPNLFGPHRLLAGFGDVKVTAVYSGCASAHVVAIGAGGEAFAWGRNSSAQLGHGDTTLRPGPQLVAALKGTPIASASTGKAHTVFLTAAGELRACGACKQGAVGPHKVKAGLDYQAAPGAIDGLPPMAAVASGANFNLALDRDGGAWAWGYGEFGVLGNGTDGEHNTKEGSVKLAYEVQQAPRQVRALAAKKVVNVACGTAHCAALADDGTIFTWGSGDYGRLGFRSAK